MVTAQLVLGPQLAAPNGGPLGSRPTLLVRRHYDFGSDGSFLNVHGDDTWVEVWQGGADFVQRLSLRTIAVRTRLHL